MNENNENNNNSPERKDLSNKLNDLFGLPTVVSEDISKNQIVKLSDDDKNDEQNANQDFDDTRDTLRELETMGKDVLDHFVQIARESESPRAIEVLANYMKTLSEISLSKLDIHERKKALREKTADKNTAPMNIQNANIVVGTTADILARRNNKNIDESTSE